MTIAERKEKLIERINRSNAQEFERLEALLLGEAQLNAAIDRAKILVAKGHTTPHGQVKKKYEKWLTK